jgi:outer membrane protein OmpA-like peptidoglycan-associated protein
VLSISKRRAEAVKNFLVSAYGIDKRSLMTTGYGEYLPIASNQTAAYWAARGICAD